MKKIILILFVALLIGCKKENVKGIKIGDTLLTHQSLEQNKQLEKLIKEALNKNAGAIVDLINFPNGGGASAYDLGYIITQIIYQVGENDIANIVKEIPQKERKELRGFIAVGLAYGDNNYDGEMDNLRIENEFPSLNKMLSQ